MRWNIYIVASRIQKIHIASEVHLSNSTNLFDRIYET